MERLTHERVNGIKTGYWSAATKPRIASEMIREYIGTEGNAHQNLCTFVQTYMEPEAAELMKDTLEKYGTAGNGKKGETP